MGKRPRRTARAVKVSECPRSRRRPSTDTHLAELGTGATSATRVFAANGAAGRCKGRPHRRSTALGRESEPRVADGSGETKSELRWYTVRGYCGTSPVSAVSGTGRHTLLENERRSRPGDPLAVRGPDRDDPGSRRPRAPLPGHRGLQPLVFPECRRLRHEPLTKVWLRGLALNWQAVRAMNGSANFIPPRYLAHACP